MNNTKLGGSMDVDPEDFSKELEDFDEENLEEQFIPGYRKESKRSKDALMNKVNKWKIKGQ